MAAFKAAAGGLQPALGVLGALSAALAVVAFLVVPRTSAPLDLSPFSQAEREAAERKPNCRHSRSFPRPDLFATWLTTPTSPVRSGMICEKFSNAEWSPSILGRPPFERRLYVNRLLFRLGITGVCAVAAGMLLAAPAQAAPSAPQAAGLYQVIGGKSQPNSASARLQNSGLSATSTIWQRQLILDDEYVLDLGRYHIPGDDDAGCGGWPPECWLTHYYYYVELRAPGDIEQEAWDRISQYVRCVVNEAGLALIVSTIATGGTSVPVFVAAFTVAANDCGNVTLEEMARAYVNIRHDT
ncbi:hypothetical protein ODJ79_27965 [Actinoplanes sp. KI2]|uniref:hypothetical protein n=1 Tax=Actinoplanes sp. KI2 TaxID=2983315 RepID=UPI0021D5CDB8|nr:hypothetical protein [Actinoplanes sp. KI2]MCU7727572.1 hypothetical protein [Actinoplanes sp. KI2]